MLANHGDGHDRYHDVRVTPLEVDDASRRRPTWRRRVDLPTQERRSRTDTSVPEERQRHRQHADHRQHQRDVHHDLPGDRATGNDVVDHGPKMNQSPKQQRSDITRRDARNSGQLLRLRSKKTPSDEAATSHYREDHRSCVRQQRQSEDAACAAWPAASTRQRCDRCSTRAATQPISAQLPRQAQDGRHRWRLPRGHPTRPRSRPRGRTGISGQRRRH